MQTGYLYIQAHTGDDALPVPEARVKIFDQAGRLKHETNTDGSGNTQPFPLPAPDSRLTLDPAYREPAYSQWEVTVEKIGFVTGRYHGVQVVATQTSLLPAKMEPLVDEPDPPRAQDYYIPPAGLLLTDTQQPVSRATRTLRQVVIPEYITVHLGAPANAAARNVRVRFPDYIKNVVSSEIYPTWPESALEANLHAIVTFALNRVYTEWYRNRGFPFDITSHTGYDQYFREGAQIYENISRMVDALFHVYARRMGFRNPFFTSFCNGTTSVCNGLSQWGTVSLANQGMTPLQILRYYYPDDLELVAGNNIGGITESYPGYPLRLGSQGTPVRQMQDYLNRIRVNFPLIPRIPNPDGVFGPETERAVRVFQQTFALTPDGIIGRATWNKITFIFVGVARLAELDSEGQRITIGANPPNVILSLGDRGEHVLELQFLLSAIAPFYNSVPPAIQDGVFDTEVLSAVIEFQKTFGLPPDGIVGPTTWNKLYAVYRGIYEDNPLPPAENGSPAAPPYPGVSLALGSTGTEVRRMQTYLNTIRIVYPEIPPLTVDGVFGNATRQAVIAFQNRFLLAPDGIIGPATWDYIVRQYQLATGGASLDLEFPGVLLRLGSAGSSVRLLQSLLADLRAPYPSLPSVTVDGIFGANTEAAVMGFQRLFGLTPDGIVGPATWNEIVRQHTAVSG